jgi:hypothetical protein
MAQTEKEPEMKRRRPRHPRLGLTRSMWRRIEDLVHRHVDFCVCGRQFVGQESVVTGFDAEHRLILAGRECSGRIKIPVIRSIYLASPMSIRIEEKPAG